MLYVIEKRGRKRERNSPGQSGNPHRDYSLEDAPSWQPQVTSSAARIAQLGLSIYMHVVCRTPVAVDSEAEVALLGCFPPLQRAEGVEELRHKPG